MPRGKRNVVDVETMIESLKEQVRQELIERVLTCLNIKRPGRPSRETLEIRRSVVDRMEPAGPPVPVRRGRRPKA